MVERPTGFIAAALVALPMALEAGCAAPPPNPIHVAFARCIEQDTIQGYTRFLDTYGYAVESTEVRSRLWKKRLGVAATRADRCELVLDMRHLPEAVALLPEVIAEFLEHAEYRRLAKLRQAFPEDTADPRIDLALAPPWAEGEAADQIRTVVHESRSLQQVHAASGLSRTNDPRVLPYILDLLRDASRYDDLQVVEITQTQYARMERPKGSTSVAAEARSAIWNLVNTLHPRREMQEVLLEYRDDESEQVRDLVTSHFEDQARLLMLELDKAERGSIGSLDSRDFRLNPWAVDGLVERVTAAGHPYARQFAILVLGVNRVEGARAALVMALADEHPIVRRSAVAALAALGKSAEALRPMLDDDAAPVAAKAAEALGLLGDRAARPRLIELLGSKDAAVRTSAAGALARLGYTPDTETARAAFLLAAEDWEALRALPPEVVASVEPPGLDPYALHGLGRAEPEAPGRTTEEIFASFDALEGRPRTAILVAATWRATPVPEGVTFRPIIGNPDISDWRRVLVQHARAYRSRRWPYAVLAYVLPKYREVFPDRRFAAHLGSRIVDRRLTLMEGADGIVLEPGAELYVVHNVDGSPSYTFGGDQSRPPAPEPYLRWRLAHELERARAFSTDLSPAVLLVFTRSFALTRDLELTSCRDAAYDAVCKVWGEDRRPDTLVRRHRIPEYGFYTRDGSMYPRLEQHLAREVAEATGEAPAGALLARDVLAQVAGEVTARDEEARLTIRADDGTEHRVEGLIATTRMVGDRVLPGDLIGIAPR